MKIGEITYRVYMEEGSSPPWELVYKDIDTIETAIDLAEGEWNAYCEAESGNINEDETVFYYDVEDFDEDGCVGKIVTEDGDTIVKYYIMAAIGEEKEND